MSKQDTAQLIAGIAVLLMTLVLAIVGRKDPVARATVTYTDTTGVAHTLTPGAVMPRNAVAGVDSA
jgi:hypothetical protein